MNLGDTSVSEIADIVSNATGSNGPNANYVISLAQSLVNMGIAQNKAQHVFDVERTLKKKLEGK